VEIPAVVYLDLDDGKNKVSIWGTVTVKSFELNILVVCNLDQDDREKLRIWKAARIRSKALE
jgi:hypothetical protein